jgi:DNA-binding NarL/FixJ family response regulator
MKAVDNMRTNKRIINKNYRHIILELLASGDRPKEIANKLSKEKRNVIQTIHEMRKLINARSTVQLVIMYRENFVGKNFPFKEKKEKNKRDEK